MKDKLQLYTAAFLALLYCLPSNAGTLGDYWHAWSDEAFAEAKQTGKLVLLDLTAEWCVFCKKMDETTYRDDQVIETINEHFIPVRAADETHPQLATRYARYGRPLTVVFAYDGSEVIARPGYLQPQWMVWFLEAVAADPDPEAHK